MNKAAGTVFIQIIADFIPPYIMHSKRFKLGEHFGISVWEPHHQILFVFQILVLIPTNPFTNVLFFKKKSQTTFLIAGYCFSWNMMDSSEVGFVKVLHLLLWS